MWQPEGPTYPHWGERFGLKKVLLAPTLLLSLAILGYYLTKSPARVTVSNITWKPVGEICAVSFTLSNVANKNLSGTLSVRAMALSGTSPSNIHQPSPYLVGQKSFPFTLNEGEAQIVTKDIPSFQNHGCDAGTVFAVVDD